MKITCKECNGAGGFAGGNCGPAWETCDKCNGRGFICSTCNNTRQIVIDPPLEYGPCPDCTK